MVTTQSPQPAGQTEPFSVKDCALGALATGRKARLLQVLKSILADVDPLLRQSERAALGSVTTARRRHTMPFGAELLEDGRVQFRLWAPGATMGYWSLPPRCPDNEVSARSIQSGVFTVPRGLGLKGGLAGRQVIRGWKNGWV